MADEMTRLQVLRSYVILDAEREQAFERITSLASRIFDVPIALVSIVDLGRQWFMSNYGLGDVRETPRKLAFCSRKFVLLGFVFCLSDSYCITRFSYGLVSTLFFRKQTPFSTRKTCWLSRMLAWTFALRTVLW